MTAEHDAITRALDILHNMLHGGHTYGTEDQSPIECLKAARAQLDALLARVDAMNRDPLLLSVIDHRNALLAENARLREALRGLEGTVNALDMVCASRQLSRKLRDALAATRDEVRGIVRRAIEDHRWPYALLGDAAEERGK